MTNTFYLGVYKYIYDLLYDIYTDLRLQDCENKNDNAVH